VLLRILMQKVYRSRLLPGKHKRLHGWEQVDKVIDIDQSPIGRTPRSNPATYTGVFDHVRKLFAQVPEARVRGYQPGRFSFNVRGGRCENCAGDGQIKIEMHFLPDVYVTCEVCKGRRYNRETLEVRYKNRSIADVLEMSVDEGLEFFRNIPPIHRHMQTLSDVGLGYIKLGQPAPTLSGGEAQRIKLSSELHKRATGSTLYVLDEPTTGLHFEDVRKLLQVLQRLVSTGNTVLVIEHNLDVIKTADWIVDLGPEGGDAGGEVVASGTPEQVAAAAGSHTGRFLAEVLGSLPLEAAGA
jgi:excinuclease ABC subunit A